ncbi:hypothetical protein D9M68_670970 [compost metagenome]
MGAQHQALGVLRIEALHDARPQQAGRAHLGDLQVEVHADRPEKREAPGEAVHVHALGDRGLHVLLPIGQREGQFQCLVGAGLLHVVPADRDRVELRHVLGRVLDDVADDLHRRLGRVDVGVAHHELFQNVVLNRSAQLVLRHALLFGRDHIARQHRQHGAVHGHGHTHLVERDLIEEDLHVLHRVDRHAGLAHVAGHARVVRVVAAVRGQVEGHTDALPARGQRLAVEGVGFFGGGKAGVLADRPGPHRVHGGLRTADEGLETGQRVGVRQVRRVGRRVQRLDADAVGREPVQRGHVTAGRGFLGRLGPGFESGGLEFGRVLALAHGGAVCVGNRNGGKPGFGLLASVKAALILYHS